MASLLTGLLARGAGVRQADAVREAGGRQADALLATVQSTHEEQRAVRVLDFRRQAYARFIEAVETVMQARIRGEDRGDDHAALRPSFAAVLMEGPADVAAAARELVDCLGAEGFSSSEDIERTSQNFIDVARSAIASVSRSGSGSHSG
jgi:hypothetical protein